MRLSRILLVSCLAVGAIGLDSAFAQFGLPKLPGKRNNNKDDSRKKGQDSGPQGKPAGVPIPPDSPIFEAFRKLDQQSAYHQRMTITANDPQVAQMMAQMGFAPAETITAGDMKQVSMHFKMPALGQTEDFELRTVLRNGKMAKKWSSPGSDRIMKEQDAQLAKQFAQQEASSASSIAKSLAMGPMGLVSSAVSAAGAAASAAEAANAHKQIHEFFEWSCADSKVDTSKAGRPQPPPMTDLRVIGDQTIEGTAATGYEFYVQQGGKPQGPMQMFVAKDSGLPMRIGMNDPRAGGGMQMDYFGFNQGGDIEIPSCMK